MATNNILNQPLLPGKRLSNKRRFRRCRSAPFVDRTSNFTSSSPGSIHSLSQTGPSLKQGAAFLIIYLGAATTCFFLVRHQIKGVKTDSLVDSLYLCIVTMTTVGYGDLVPDGVSSKLLSCACVFSGMAIVGFILSKAADYFVEKQEALLTKALSLPDESMIMKEIGVNRARNKFITTMGFLLVLMTVGVAFLWKVERLSLVDAFYCVCSTVTTLGYGDKSFSTASGRIFAVAWILSSTICLAQFFLYMAEWKAERNQWLLAHRVLNRRLTFVDLESADFDQDGSVGAAEFIIYKLKEMGKITQEDVSKVMEEFEDLDVDHSGTLTPGDLTLAA